MRSSTTVNKVAERLSFVVAAILVLLPFHALLTTWAGSNFGHLDLLRIWKEILLTLTLPLALWLVWCSVQLKKWLSHSWIVRLFGIYILLHLILGAWAYAHHEVNTTALVYALIINLRFIGFFILCVVVAAHSDFLNKHWRKILLIPAGIVIAFGLMQKLFLPYDFLRHFGYSPKTIPAYQTVDADLDFRRVQSTLRGANPLGAYLVLVISAIVASLRKNFKWLGLLLLGALIVLFYTYSRSAEIGVAIALGLIVWWGTDKKNSVREVILLVVLTVVVLGAGLLAANKNKDIQSTFFHSSDSSAAPRSSNADRLASMEAGAKDVIHQPLGKGPGTAGPASFRNDHPPRISENYFLQIGQEAGVIGMILFAAINLLVAKELWVRRNSQLAKILLASLAGITFVNLLSHAWTDDTLAYVWWGLAGVALAPILNSKRRVR